MKLLRLSVLWLSIVSCVHAEVTLAPLFQDHAVLQRDQAVPVWGRATPGEHVSVAFQGQVVGATAAADGRWMVYLAPLSASGEPAELVVTATNVITLHDILVGEVWLASGQSNMEMQVKQVLNGPAEVAAANHSQIRLFHVAHQVADAPTFTVPGTWQPCTPESAATFSAVSYFFARELQKKLGVPIGMVGPYWGATPVESWTDAATLRGTKAWPALDERWQKILPGSAEYAAKYPALRAAWGVAEDHARATHTKNPLDWPPPPMGRGTPFQPSGLFNGMIAPLQPYALRGVIWYQGEQNWPHPEEYTELFPTMIRSWRAQWGQGDFPFLFVQIANYNMAGDATGRGWARQRDAQMSALSLPNTGMAVTIDIGDAKDIHPRNKQEVGRRLAMIAKTQTYGIPGDYQGPTFASATVERGAMRVHFKHAATGLISANKPVQSLEIAGADKVFHPATGKIERDTLVVSAREVKQPVAVRYAWSNAPVANLFNGAGLPAVPFRSDDW